MEFGGLTALDDELARLGDEVAELSDLVDEALRRAVRSLLEGDVDLATQVVAHDAEINRRRAELERDCIATIATRRPAGGDVRSLAGVLEIATELERMGDYAKDVAGVVHADRVLPPAFRHAIERIADTNGTMLERATVAFLERDADSALQVAGERARIGTLAGGLYHELLDDPPHWGIDRTFELLSVVHDLVRFADRVVNVCERTVQVAYGEFVELDQRELIAPYEAGR